MPQKIELTKKHIAAGIVVAILMFGYEKMGSETLTLHAYYPSPVGIYTRLVSTGKAAFARERGDVTIGANNADTRPDGRLGIGTSQPLAKLDVRGLIKVGTTDKTLTCSVAGAIRYNSDPAKKLLEYCDGSLWKSAGGDSSGSWPIVSEIKPTDALHNGNFGGYPGIQTFIEDNGCGDGGYHVCERGEIDRWRATGHSLPITPGEYYWVSTGFAFAADGYVFDDCEGWTTAGGGIHAITVSTNWSPVNYCNAVLKVLCCKY